MKAVRKYVEETGKSEVTLFEDGIVARGIAQLHEDDMEFGNKSTGISIAYYRAASKLYFKKAIKELDTIIYIKNRYKHNKITENFINMLEERADGYLKKAMNLSYTCEEVIEDKDMFYKRMKAIRSGELSSMEYIEDLTSVLNEDFRKAIDSGMSIEISEEEMQKAKSYFEIEE